MSNIQDIVVRFHGSANFGQVKKEVAQLQNSFSRLNATMAAVRANADPFDRVDTYNSQIAQLKNLERLNRLNAVASGDWHVQTVKNISASERLTQQIQKQKLGLKGLLSEMSNYRKAADGKGNSALHEAVREQQALRGAMASQMTGNTFGKNNTDLYVPRNLGPELDSARVKYGLINQAIASAAHQTVNWGKNTQWAGRQITVGLTMPLGMAAVGAAALALKVDQELTRIAKVYDTSANSQAGKERELADLREQSLEGATRMAQTYGQKMEDILDVQAQLAATGLTGASLHQATDQAVRIATLGEMEYQKAVDMTISLQTAFKLSTQELTEAFDMMNAVENATSLGIQDIADAVPRAASALSQLGGTVQDMTVMMAAMKEAGVIPAEAANALKSATSRLLDPTAEAVETFSTKFNIDLESVVESAQGNIYEIMQTLAGMTRGFDTLDVQQGINDLFGTYQFNRLSALWTNLGDAMVGVENQTFKAMETVAMSAPALADIAEAELKRKQESIQGRFKAAVETMKAALVPLGMTVLEFITPIIEAIGGLLRGFNDLNGFTKGLILTLLGLGAIAGPALMLVGIFANLIGNVFKMTTSLGNLRFKFRALSAEEAAANIMANNAKSAFNSQAQSAAVLAHTIRDLTLAMEQNAVAQGMMMSKSGVMVSRGANGVSNTRKVEQDANGRLRYAPGSLDAAGNKIDRRSAVSPEDKLAFTQMRESSGVIADNSKKTATSWGTVGRVLGGVAAVGAIFAVMSGDALGISDTFMNILMVATTIGFMFPGVFKSVWDLVKKTGAGIKGWGAGLTGLFAGKKSISGMAFVLQDAFKTGGIKQVGKDLQMMAPKFTSIAGHALKIFGPIGILAAGALIVKGIVSDMNRMEEQQQALATSGKAWAEAIGYTYAPGSLDPLGGTDTAEAYERTNLVNQMTEAQEGLRDALKAAGDAGRGYEVSMQQAMRALANGATVAQARQVMEASLEMAGNDPIDIDQLMIDFDKIDLSDPAEVRSAITSQLQSVLSDVDMPSLRPSQNEDDGWLDSAIAGMREWFGGDLTSEARTWGQSAGEALADGLNAAGDNMAQKVQMFDALEGSVSGQMADYFNSIKGEYSDEFADMGIESAEQLMQKLAELEQEFKEAGNTDGFSDVEKQIWMELENTGSSLAEFQSSYEELIDTILQGIGNVMGWDAEKIAEIRKEIVTLEDARASVGVRKHIISEKDAMDQYSNAVSRSASQWANYTDKEKTAILNTYRAKAGMEDATHWTQGFGNAAAVATGSVEDLANATALLEPTAEQLTQMTRSAMEGTMNDIYSEASRRLDVQRNAQIDSIRQAGENSQKALDDEGKRQDAAFTAREKAQDKHWDNVIKGQEKAHKAQSKAAEDYWDGQEKAAENAWEAEEKRYDSRIENIENAAKAADKETEQRVDAIEAVIKAEEEAEEARRRIFEAEQRRIERMAERLNTNIDFNIALNSGDLDEAAKIANDVSAREQSWNLEDREREMEDQLADRKKGLEAQIEEIEGANDARQEAFDKEIERLGEEKEARKEVHDAQMEQIRIARDAAMEALQARQEAEKEALQEQRTIDQERLRSARETARENLENRKENNRLTTENSVAHAQAQFDADKRQLESRLRELQAFVPRNQKELKDHIAQVEALYAEYGLRLQTQGNGWAAHIGESLKTNVKAAGISMQNDINWTAMGNQISARMSGGIGITAGDMQFFIRNGRFPTVANNKWDPMNMVQQSADRILAQLQGINLGRHSGGYVFHKGGSPTPNFSQADRVGIPRSASLYPSEVTAVLKRGEFVVNENATRKNRGLLEAINSGKNNPDVVRHEGGMADMGALAAGGMGTMFGQVMEDAITERAMSARFAQVESNVNAFADVAKKKMAEKAAQKAALAGGNFGGSRSTPNGVGGLGPQAAAARAFVTQKWGITNIGGYANRNVAGTNSPSDHARGKAIDIMMANYRTAPAIAKGNEIANWFVQNPSNFGTKYVIWRDQINEGRGWKPYGHPGGGRSDTLQHRDHVHVSVFDDGGYIQPGQTGVNFSRKPEPVFNGAQWDILKANIGNQSFDLGNREGLPMPVRVVEDVANGGQTVYDIDIDLRGAYIKEELDIEAAVERAIEKKESKIGRRRVI